ncbi:hypothetical protein PsalN5692_02627 [Piscirickettsia salmonis]|uniref:hypothetical protein n=1 Tax=Piscirickettsia salmonis TaxID=1238 RepID=UPI0012B96FC9|nr:hypothetical protein [Piscirickettsia salmonis]QGP51146.1 hypothetical protein PsalN5692_02627 [Piscirickettsia salmonis]
MCRIGRSVYRYQPKKQVADTKIKKVLTDLAKVHHRWGFDKMMAKIKQNRKRRYLGRYFAHPMMQNRRAKRDDYKPSAVRVTQRCVP